MKKPYDAIRRIAYAAQLSAVLEASAEKPGNVTPTHDFSDTGYSGYLAGSVALGRCVGEAAYRGYGAGCSEIGMSDIGVGTLILEGVLDVRKSHSGGNTHLGMIMLFVPISAAAGMCLAKGIRFPGVRKSLKAIMAASTKKDSYDLYTAIETAKTGGIGKLVKKDISFADLMAESAEKDRICEELSSGLQIIFADALPCFEKNKKKEKDVRKAIQKTYLCILSKYPDTLIEKKKGKVCAKAVSKKARETLAGKTSIECFDEYLRTHGNSLNPGTSADLIAATIFLDMIKETIF